MQDHPSFNEHAKDTTDDSFSIREQVDQYLVHWKWFLLSVVVCLILAGLYLRYTVPQYRASATMMVKDERKGGLQSELSALGDLATMSGVKSNVDNEIEVIKSRSIMEQAVENLNFTVQYFIDGRVKSIEVYDDKPVIIDYTDIEPEFYTSTANFSIEGISKSKFKIVDANKKELGQYDYGSIVKMKNFRMVVALKPNISPEYSLRVSIRKFRGVVAHYKNALGISTIGKNTSVVELTMQDPIKEKAEDIIDEVIKVYNDDAISDKNAISESTQRFIMNRLDAISKELGDVEQSAETFKKENQLTDITSEAGVYLQNSVAFERELIETETQLRIIQSMMQFMETSSADDLIPANIVPNDRPSSELIAEHNQLLLEKNRYSVSATPQNSVIKNTDARLKELRSSINESLSRVNASLRIRKADLEKQGNLVRGQISRIPSQERQFRSIGRQQQIKESLYLYLLQKREEIAISLAVKAPNAKVIDPAMSSNSPVSPKGRIIYLAAFVIGLAIPFLIIYLIQLLDTKIKTRNDVEAKVSIPFLGDIPKSESVDEIININSRSSTAEAIRIVRTNLEFMLGGVQEGRAKTIFVTSTLPKEGKTFVAVNLATTIALSNKKVLLIGLDVRNPKIDHYMALPANGLTNYIAQNGGNIRDYIMKMDNFENLYVLPSGVVPPNPVELLMNQKVDSMFEELKNEFEYIIVDTAPVSVVTDTLLIAKNADAFIFVMRANYLDKRMLRVSESFYREKKLPNMSVVLNDTIWKTSFGYGYGYGYGYNQEVEKKPWYKRLFSKS
ncbi:MAG: polysaccharide biosynthesis tyrosine autokinase [Flavobacterium sp.]|nr:polysaccharide biosynthesis tyrosine autokinase [Flavobacterium sp.]